MTNKTKIEWTDYSWNPWQGCKKVSPGCANCYMYRDKKRFKQDPELIIRSALHTFWKPYRLKEPAKVFVCSWSDFFIEGADVWRNEAWQVIKNNPHLTFQILTKRPENIGGRLPEGWPLKNVWLGVTAENQEMADLRIPILLKIPAKVHFVSIEPMLGPVDLQQYLSCKGCGYTKKDMQFHGDHYLCKDKTNILDWVICGGESGPGARMMFQWWAIKLKEQCNDAIVPFFMKQMTKKLPIPHYLKSNEFPNWVV